MLNKIAFAYDVAENQSKAWTPYHVIYDCMIQYGTYCEPFKFTYQCNPNHTTPNIEDVMRCLLLDAHAYGDNLTLQNFADEFGYEFEDGILTVQNMFDACKKTYEALHAMFSDAELEKLEKEVEE